MARIARISIVGYPHQVTQRGNYEQRVFEEDADYRRYLELFKEYADRYSIEIWAYCLMPNHVHFICVPKSDGGLARGFNTVHMRYAQYFHAKKGLTGHLWKGRFLSCMIDDESIFEEARFIENNPVLAGLARRAEDYRWSSAHHHVMGSEDPIIGRSGYLKTVISDWQSYLYEKGNISVLNRTRKCLKTGRPSGNSEWIHTLEAIMGRRLLALPRGRPRKPKQR